MDDKELDKIKLAISDKFLNDIDDVLSSIKKNQKTKLACKREKNPKIRVDQDMLKEEKTSSSKKDDREL